MAYALYLAGFDVKDVHMTDLISGRETLDEINIIVFVGAFQIQMYWICQRLGRCIQIYEKARIALENFYKRSDTLSLESVTDVSLWWNSVFSIRITRRDQSCSLISLINLNQIFRCKSFRK